MIHTAEDGTQDDKEEGPPKSPYLKAGWFSRLTLWWAVTLITKANKIKLTTKDVYETLPEAKSERLAETFQMRWQRFSEGRMNASGSLFKAVLIHFKVDVLRVVLILLSATCVRFVEPFLIVALLRHLSDTERTSDTAGYVYAVLMLLGLFLKAFAELHFNITCHTLSMNMRTTCLTMIYQKIMRMSMMDCQRTSSGKIITLMSNDVETFQNTMLWVPNLFTGPFLLLAIFVVECFEIGYLAIALIVCIGVFIGGRYWMGQLNGKLRSIQEVMTDKRIQLMNEIITGMRIVKIFCWEKMYADRAMKLRGSEMQIGLKRTFLQFLGTASDFAISKVLTLVTLTAYVYLTHNTLTLETTIKLIAWLKALNLDCLHGVPASIHCIHETIVATERIKVFLMSEDLANEPTRKTDQAVKVCIKNGFANWMSSGTKRQNSWVSSQAEQEYTLHDINLSVDSGSLIAVVGPVGASKSSLLMMILGELTMLKGQKEVCGTVSYVPQESWLLPDTVRKNIIFDKEYDEDKYLQVLQACSLDEDINSFPNKDLSLIGERGLCLSGGQKARINLARAMYQDTDIYLFDDPLSALDSKVGKNVFHLGMCGLLRSKLQILVTHQLQYLPYVDEVLIMDKGIVTAKGKYSEIVSKLDLVTSSTMRKNSPSGSDDTMRTQDQAELDGVPREVPTEKDEIGSVSYKIYLKFFSFGLGKYLLPPMLLCMFTVMGTDVTSDWMLATWYNSRDTGGNSSSWLDVESSASYDTQMIWTTWGVVGGYLVFLVLYNTFPALMMTYASRNLYNTMFHRVLHAPSHFFETNPVGQVLNRFSRDTYFMDVQLQQPIAYIKEVMAFGLSYAVYVCVLNPWMLIPLTLYIIFVFVIAHFIIGAITQTKRLEASLRSPLFSHLSTTIQGLPVIRASQKEEYFLNKAYQLIDNHTSSWYMFVVTRIFLGLCIDLPGFVCVGIYFILIHVSFSEEKDAGAAALSLIYLLNTFLWLQIFIKRVADIECMMTSVERIHQYSTLEQEAAAYTDVRPPKHWPSHGNIQLCDVSLTYKDLDTPALGPINLTIQSGQKVGVVGRTGAGKSSLITSLLRMVEPTGSTKIDGIDLKTLGLTDVRSSISVIPQDPLLFSGTLRKNMDCFDQCSDEQIWGALQQVQLTEKVRGLPQQLYEDIGEGGGHFSVGQRQLLCMARALLRRKKIVILDEATANVDNRTDSIIQETLGREFSGMTVLTVAHRLDTIIKYDKILVLEKGKMVQFDHPHLLLQDTSGLFYQMLKTLGEDHFNILGRMAYNAYHAESTWL